MDKLDFVKLLNRQHLKEKIVKFLNYFEENKSSLTIQRGIYVYGNPGVGKTCFIKDILKEMNYDVVHFDGGDVRNKSSIELITKYNASDKTVLNMFYRNKKPIAIIMDEIDSMNSGDKGGINALIKLIRPKKTKKQKLEVNTNNPIICIGSYLIDKKIKELMKVCFCVELENPTQIQTISMLKEVIPDIDEEIIPSVLEYINNDFRRLRTVIKLHENGVLTKKFLSNITLKYKNYEDVKMLTSDIFNSNLKMQEHNHVINETDRTTVGLLWHENVIDGLANKDEESSLSFYKKALDNICFSDYIDRVTFQKQIWQFNEMSSLIKTFYNNKLYHDNVLGKKKQFKTIRFTKVLTKYSTEYNNAIFFRFMCQELGMDKKDLLSFFVDLQRKEDNYDSITEETAITKLDINRVFKFIEHFAKV